MKTSIVPSSALGVSPESNRPVKNECFRKENDHEKEYPSFDDFSADNLDDKRLPTAHGARGHHEHGDATRRRRSDRGDAHR
jgi:hypothetical protein